jgi:uncharacterized protein involved in outer membrane biogenesis
MFAEPKPLTIQPISTEPSGRPGADPAPEIPVRRHRARAVLIWAGGVLGGLVLAVVLFLALFDWNAARGAIGRLASARMHREVVLAGPLEVHPWSLKPSATIRGLRIGNPSWAGPGQTVTVEGLLVQIKLLPLLRGQLVLLQLEADKPNLDMRRDLQGRTTWDFSGGKKTDEPLKMPPVRRFVIKDGHLNFADAKRKLSLNATLDASERLGAANRGFTLAGDGVLNGNRFLLSVLGGPLLNVDPNKPYPFNADIRSGATRVQAQGVVPKPFDLGRLTVDLKASGPDLAELYDLTGVPFPNTPPYSLKGRLVRDGKVYRVADLNGRVGDSDLAGTLSVDATAKRPFLKADLRTRSLDFDDLAATFGGAPSVKAGETASAGQVAVAQSLRAERRYLPDATLKVDRIRAIDADVRYRAASIHDAMLPLRAADVHVKLDHGLLIADPASFDLPQGRISGSARLDARPATPITTVDVRVSNARLEQLIPIKTGGQPLSGGLVARIKLTGAGDSVHRAASNADGEVLLVAPNGEIRRAFAELLGINVTKGLGLLWAKNQDTTPIRCAVADFKATNGLLRADHVVFDTGPVLATGHGTIDLGKEAVDFQIQGHPKSFRLVRLLAPINIKGPISGPPKVSVDTSKALGQGGFAAALATFASPLAAVLPFVDAGLAKDANCAALIGAASRQGAPVKTAKPATGRPHG